MHREAMKRGHEERQSDSNGAGAARARAKAGAARGGDTFALSMASRVATGVCRDEGGGQARAAAHRRQAALCHCLLAGRPCTRAWGVPRLQRTKVQPQFRRRALYPVLRDGTTHARVHGRPARRCTCTSAGGGGEAAARLGSGRGKGGAVRDATPDQPFGRLQCATVWPKRAHR